MDAKKLKALLIGWSSEGVLALILAVEEERM
jgi:hypothetical protein